MMATRSSAALADLVRSGSSNRAHAMVVELQAFDRWLTSFTAFIPFLGPMFVQGASLKPLEKTKLTWISIAVTGAVLAAIVALFSPLTAASSYCTLEERIGSDIKTLGAIAETFRAEHGEYPDAATWKRTAELPDPRFFDPWGRPYRYEPDETGVRISSLGRDGVAGGSGPDADHSEYFSSAPDSE
jgi:hypothetical protein